MSVKENRPLEFPGTLSAKPETSDEIQLDITSHTKQEKRVNKALYILPACLTLIMTGFGIIIPVYPQRLASLGLGAGTLALMEGAFGLGMFLFSTPAGVLANRIGRKPLILSALIGFIVTNLMLAFLNGVPIFITARFLEGIFVAGFFPAAMAMIGDSVPMQQQGRWMGLMTTAQSGGLALGPAIGGVLYQSWGFTSPFLLSAGFALASSLLALVLLPETLPEPVRLEELARQEKKRHGERDANAINLWHLAWLYAALLIIDFGTTFIFPFSVPQYPFYFGNALHYSPAQYGLIISAYGLTVALFPLVLGRLSERLSKKSLVVLGSLLSAALNLGLLFLHQYLLLIASAAITGLGSAMLMPAMGTIYLNATTDQNRSQLMGIRTTAISFAIFLAPFSQAAVGPWITPQITFAIASVVSIAITIFSAIALKEQRPS
jgi:MFS family permease